MVVKLIIICLLLLALMKWAIYKLSLMAVLLYYGEKGFELPSNGEVQEYRVKVAKKYLNSERREQFQNGNALLA